MTSYQPNRERPVRLTVAGPLPPPVHGQSVVTEYLLNQLLMREGVQIRVANTSEGTGPLWRRLTRKIINTLAEWLNVARSDAVYISVNSGMGMWLSTVAAGIARTSRARIVLHHHSYANAKKRNLRTVALARMAGKNARHVVLSDSMANELRNAVPEAHSLLILRNAGLVDSELANLPLKADGRSLVLGHLSNLSLEKGIAEVVNLACSLYRSGIDIRLIVAGPATTKDAKRHLGYAKAVLEDRFDYRGSVFGDAKLQFFNDITHFVFPSRYKHEAMPLVLYEAMAAGVVCLATLQGSISEQLAGSASKISSSVETFVEEMQSYLTDIRVSRNASAKSRQAYLQARTTSEEQLARIVDFLTAAR